jgi:hypothetical protein
MTVADSRFDGRVNFAADDDIEGRLDRHFEKFSVTPSEIWKNFPIYTRRLHLKRFLAHYELFQKVVDLPGDIVELGVFRGASLMSWANFVEIRCMGDRQRRVFGFDNFAGFTEIETKDGAVSEQFKKTAGGFDASGYEDMLRDAISIYDADRFIPYKARVALIKGDVEKTVPEFVVANPGVRISLLHFDVDLLWRSSSYGRSSCRVGSWRSMNMGSRRGKAKVGRSMNSSPRRKSRRSYGASRGRAIPEPMS